MQQQNKDADYWARVHIEGDRRKPIFLDDRRGGRGINAPIRWRQPQPQEQE